MLKIASPISHLFTHSEDANLIMRESDCLECRDAGIGATFAGQELFHCELQPIHEMEADEFQYLEKIAGLKKDLKVISFHAASACRKPILDGYQFLPGGKQYSREALLDNARNNFPRIKEIFGSNVNIAIENNNYYQTEAYRWVTDAEFLSELVYENDLLFLFDTAHARITAHNRKLSYEAYLQRLPLRKTIQVHINRCEVKHGVARDEHGAPDTEEWDSLQELLAAYPGIRYITIEFYQDKNILIQSLRKAREVINELSGKCI